MSEYYDDDGFAGYVETTKDPGGAMLAVTIIFCLVTNMMLPCLVNLGRRYQKRRALETTDEEEEQKEEEEEEKVDQEDNEKDVEPEQKSETQVGASPSHEDGNTASSSSSPSNKMLPHQYQVKKADSVISEGSKESSRAQYLNQGMLVGLGLDIQPNRPFAESALSVPSAAGSTASRNTNMSFITAVTSSMLDAGLISPLKGRARRRQGTNGRRRRLQEEYIESAQNLNQAAININDVGKTSNDDKSVIKQKDATEDKTPKSAFGSPPSVVSAVSQQLSRAQMSQGAQPSDASYLAAMSWKDFISEIGPCDAADADEPDISPALRGSDNLALENVDLCCGDHAWWRPATIAHGWDDLLDLADWDNETKRLFRLAIPFSIQAMVEGGLELAVLALIAQNIGTAAVSAYTITNLMIGLTGDFVGGVVDTVTVLTPHAVSAENNLLAGQYVQLSAILYVLASFPFILIWSFAISPVMLRFGFDDATAQMAQSYANVILWANLFAGVHDSYLNFLSVIDRERFSTITSVIEEFLVFFIVLISVVSSNTTLAEVGVIYLVVGLAMIFGNLFYTIRKGWVTPYLKGMVGNNALKNRSAVVTMLSTAAPLCIGTLLTYGEWELLTIFAGALGTAEVAAWGILGTVWETVEAISEGFADAGEIRCAYHLGAGRPARAKKASYKCMLVGFYSSCLFTTFIFMLGENLAYWFTADPTLQRIIIDVLPLLGVGNITLTAGSICWALVGAQGRYRLATLVSTIASWGVTLPLAAIFTYGARINLQGLTASVVMGYSVSGTAMTYLLLLSDWPHLSKEIVEQNAAEEDSDESSSSSSSRSSSHPEDS